MIWLVGNKGMLGTEVESILIARGLPHTVTDLEVDITGADAVESFAAGKQITWIVNCAAYTAVDKAESEEKRAMAINATGPANLAACANGMGARLLHISTDYVFDGTKTSPYLEIDQPNPQSAYGRTKLVGEAEAARNTGHVIIRTSWLYGVAGPNFVATMLRLMAERDTLGIVNDQQGTPTYADDLAETIVSVTTQPKAQSGIYHFSNDGRTTWYGFAREIYSQAREFGLLDNECELRPISTEEYSVPAQRPQNSVFDKTKIKTDLGIELRAWQDSLKDYLLKVKNTTGGTT